MLKIIDWFSQINSPAFQDFLFPFKIILGSIGIFFLVAIIVLIRKTSWIYFAYIWDWKEYLSFKPYGVEKITLQWEKATERMKSEYSDDYKLAIAQADLILKETLDKLGVAGDSVIEKLQKVSPHIISNTDELIEVQQIVDNVVHDPGYMLRREEAERVMKVFERTFDNLDLL
ncbi:MAG: hypothetical protein HYV78_01995 [Candidatus Wildermuthbacteria bacterium]|nr:hypothetical protein [Candidatus Wildermuthbacteria bacterium]